MRDDSIDTFKNGWPTEDGEFYLLLTPNSVLRGLTDKPVSRTYARGVFNNGKPKSLIAGGYPSMHLLQLMDISGHRKLAQWPDHAK